MEDLPLLKQIFSLCLWLQFNTKLDTEIILYGKEDTMLVYVHNQNDILIDFKLEAITKKSIERINIEVKLLIVQLLELKNNNHYKQ